MNDWPVTSPGSYGSGRSSVAETSPGQVGAHSRRGDVRGVSWLRTETPTRVVSVFSRWPYIAVVALVAAAVSDLLVEAIANTGTFGRTYLDTDDSSIVPSLIAAVMLAAGVIGGSLLAACRRSRFHRRDWLANVANDVVAQAPLRDVPGILSLQFAALFVMESAEQIVARGQLAGGLLWLGGPALFSVTAHVVVGVGCALVAGWLVRVSVPRFACLVCRALDIVLISRSLAGSAAFVVRRDAASCNHAQAARVRHISGRAPPSLPLPAR